MWISFCDFSKHKHFGGELKWRISMRCAFYHELLLNVCSMAQVTVARDREICFWNLLLCSVKMSIFFFVCHFNVKMLPLSYVIRLRVHQCIQPFSRRCKCWSSSHRNAFRFFGSFFLAVLPFSISLIHWLWICDEWIWRKVLFKNT